MTHYDCENSLLTNFIFYFDNNSLFLIKFLKVNEIK